MTIAQRLRDLRKSRHLSIERLAALIQTRDWLISQHERGQVYSSLHTAQKYARVYGMELAELFEGVEVR